ncbi:RPS13A [Symbiodinium necroappetens]|uniref:RPS13A protein n=1 Tax=Symbiodinium necroappetens TaxID=1628268 RepID=A0A813C8C6_9DINO|nr:RPS13A [Symbiodinium necroappetens]
MDGDSMDVANPSQVEDRVEVSFEVDPWSAQGMSEADQVEVAENNGEALRLAAPESTEALEAEAAEAAQQRERLWAQFSKDDLMILKDLPQSHVKPINFDQSIDQDNGHMLRTKGDKENGEDDRPARRRDRGDRGGDRGDRDRGRRNNFEHEFEHEDQSEKWRNRHERHGRENRHERERHDWHDRTDRDSRWSTWGYGANHGTQADPWNTYDEPEPQWDMPDTSAVNDGGSLLDCTLGDIRKYNAPPAPTPTSERNGIPEPPVQHVPLTAPEPEVQVREGVPKEDKHQSRGFSRWFANDKPSPEVKQDDEEFEVRRSEVPVVSAPAPLAPPVVVAPAPAPKLAAPLAPIAERPTAQPMTPGVLTGHAHATQHAHGNGGLHGNHVGSTMRNPPSAHAGHAQAQSQSSQKHGTNSAGSQILSMIGARQKEPVSHHEPSANVPNKVTVADLFQIAKGQELPPIPAMSSQCPPSSTATGPGMHSAEEEKARNRKAARDIYQASHAPAGQSPPDRQANYHGPGTGRQRAPEWGDQYAQTRAPAANNARGAKAPAGYANPPAHPTLTSHFQSARAPYGTYSAAQEAHMAGERYDTVANATLPAKPPSQAAPLTAAFTGVPGPGPGLRPEALGAPRAPVPAATGAPPSAMPAFPSPQASYHSGLQTSALGQARDGPAGQFDEEAEAGCSQS